MLDQVTLIHQALPELDPNDIDTRTKFLGRELEAPIMITGMTGGHELAEKINEKMALAAEMHKIAIGVGSQRAALEDRRLERTFRVVRERAPSVPVIGNIGVQQLPSEDPVSIAERVVEMIEADALAIHLNPAQELFQPEGDARYHGAVDKIREVARKLKVPVIVKEAGCGISFEVAQKLRNAGVNYIDVAGSGGTSWIKIEMLRAIKKGCKELATAASTFSHWGIPTAASIIEVKAAHPESYIIGSGGVRSGLDVAKVLRVGANLAGLALPVLKSALTSIESIDLYLSKLKRELRAAMFLTGSKDINDLKRKPVVLGVALTSWLEQRGINWRTVLEARGQAE